METYGAPLPATPTAADKETEDTWLAFLDRTAIAHGKRRPDYLFLLRERGALSDSERPR